MVKLGNVYTKHYLNKISDTNTTLKEAMKEWNKRIKAPGTKYIQIRLRKENVWQNVHMKIKKVKTTKLYGLPYTIF